MPDLDELRRALHAETADLHLKMSMDQIHRRARSLRTLRTTAIAAGVALVVSAVAVPSFALLNGARSAADAAAGGSAAAMTSACPSASYPWLGPLVETGASIQGPDQRHYDVVIGLTGTHNHPMFTIAFRDQQTGHVTPWDMTELPVDGEGNFTAKGQTWQFESSQLPLGANRVLDVGIYSGTAHRITASEGRTSEAHVAHDSANRRTFFWVQRTAKPLPADANVGPGEYQGPERLTISAYDSAGHLRHRVTGGFHTGNRIQNPRDNGPEPHGSPTPGVPCS